MKRFSILALLSLSLVACGGGGAGGNNLPPVVHPTATPTVKPTQTPGSSFPTASGKSMAFFNPSDVRAQATARRMAMLHTMDVTPTPSPTGSPTAAPSDSPSPAPSGSPTSAPTQAPTPFPTPTALPTPGGLSLIPTRISIGMGYNQSSATGFLMEVLDTNNNPVPELTVPTMLSQYPTLLNATTPYPSADTTYPNAWAVGLSISMIPPMQIQLAAEFPDSTGILTVNQYDDFHINCSDAPAIDLTSGVAKPGTQDSATLYMDCSNPTQPHLHIPGQFMIAAPPQQDSFGQVMPAFNNLLTVPAWAPLSDTIYNQQLYSLLGDILVLHDPHGNAHKVMIVDFSYDGNGNIVGCSMLQLSADPTNATFAF